MSKRLVVELDEELHKVTKAKAYAEGKTLKEKIIELLSEWLKK